MVSGGREMPTPSKWRVPPKAVSHHPVETAATSCHVVDPSAGESAMSVYEKIPRMTTLAQPRRMG